MIPHIISNPKIISRANAIKEELERLKITDYRFWPSVHIANKPKRTAISRAHKQIVEWAMLEGLEEVCIWEDDVWFPSDDGFQYFLDNKPTVPYDLYLGGVSRGTIQDGKTTRYSGQFCYIIHERFYPIFLHVDEHIDIDGAMAGLGTFYVCYPFAAICKPLWSENCGGMMDYSHLFKGREVRGIGVMK